MDQKIRSSNVERICEDAKIKRLYDPVTGDVVFICQNPDDPLTDDEKKLIEREYGFTNIKFVTILK